MTARCTMRSCPVRFASGPDRPCVGHQDDDSGTLTERISQFADVMVAVPGEHDGEAAGAGSALTCDDA